MIGRGVLSIASNRLAMQLADVLHSFASLVFLVGWGLIIVDRPAQRGDQRQYAGMLHLP